MKNLLYYPSFEVQKEEWLKFALLYLNELKPIIPEEGKKYLSDGFNKIISETDLVIPYEPEGEVSWQAAEDAIDLIQKILSCPKRYYEVIGSKKFLDNWRNEKSFNYTIFRKKYSLHFEEFAEGNRLGKRCKEGVCVNRALGLIYMSLLTNIISDSIDVSPITDYSDMHNISILTRQSDQKTEDSINIAMGILKLQIPSDLNEISIDDIIKLRNSRGYKKRLNAFHIELDKYFVDLENGTAKGFLNSRGSVFQDFSDELMILGAGITNFSLGIAIFLRNPQSTLEGINLISTGSMLSIGSIISVRNRWDETEPNRFARKYLADLQKL